MTTRLGRRALAGVAAVLPAAGFIGSARAQSANESTFDRVRRTKTLAQLLEQTTITDASGNVVDLEALRPRTVQAPTAEAAGDEAPGPVEVSDEDVAKA